MRLRRWLQIFSLRMRSLLHRSDVEQDLDDELRDHLELKTQHYLADGRTQEDARRDDLRDLDGFEFRK